MREKGREKKRGRWREKRGWMEEAVRCKSTLFVKRVLRVYACTSFLVGFVISVLYLLISVSVLITVIKYKHLSLIHKRKSYCILIEEKRPLCTYKMM